LSTLSIHCISAPIVQVKLQVKQRERRTGSSQALGDAASRIPGFAVWAV